MTFIPVPNGAKVEILQSKGGVQIVNRLYFTRMGDWGYADMVALGDIVEGMWIDYLKPQLSNTVSLNAIRVTDMRTDNGAVATLPVTGESGSKIEQPLPISDCLVVTLRGSHRGRWNRGRVYFSGFTEDQWDGSEFSTNVADACVNFISNVVQDANALGWNLVIASFRYNGQPREQAQIELVGSAEVRSRKPGSQRRRDARA